MSDSRAGESFRRRKCRECNYAHHDGHTDGRINNHPNPFGIFLHDPLWIHSYPSRNIYPRDTSQARLYCLRHLMY